MVQQDLTLACRPVHILESSKRVMRTRTIKYMRILWTNQMEREATWELEEMMKKYPELFEDDELCRFCVIYLFLWSLP
jgi:hypothetical protein